MLKKQPNTINDIDFQLLWESARKMRAWSSKGAKDWDKKAASFAARNNMAPYVDLFVSNFPACSEFTVLDVGAGPGTLALPIAKKALSVTALDYSETMLRILNEQAAEQKITNITTNQLAWEDDWKANNIIPHDIAIASRSLNVQDLKSALRKINSFAKQYVFLSDRISPTPFEPEAFEAIGRDFESGPDYIYTLNLLYELDIHPNINILELDKTVHFKDYLEALESFRWMLKEVTEVEDKLLQKYVQDKGVSHGDGSFSITRSHPPKWALIWWKK